MYTFLTTFFPHCYHRKIISSLFIPLLLCRAFPHATCTSTAHQCPSDPIYQTHTELEVSRAGSYIPLVPSCPQLFAARVKWKGKETCTLHVTWHYQGLWCFHWYCGCVHDCTLLYCLNCILCLNYELSFHRLLLTAFPEQQCVNRCCNLNIWRCQAWKVKINQNLELSEQLPKQLM